MSQLEWQTWMGIYRLAEMKGGRPTANDIKILQFLADISPIFTYPLRLEIERTKTGNPIREKSQYFAYSIMYKLITEGEVRIPDLGKKRKLKHVIKASTVNGKRIIEKEKSTCVYKINKEWEEQRKIIAKLFDSTD